MSSSWTSLALPSRDYVVGLEPLASCVFHREWRDEHQLLAPPELFHSSLRTDDSASGKFSSNGGELLKSRSGTSGPGSSMALYQDVQSSLSSSAAPASWCPPALSFLGQTSDDVLHKDVLRSS